MYTPRLGYIDDGDDEDEDDDDDDKDDDDDDDDDNDDHRQTLNSIIQFFLFSQFILANPRSNVFSNHGVRTSMLVLLAPFRIGSH